MRASNITGLPNYTGFCVYKPARFRQPNEVHQFEMDLKDLLSFATVLAIVFAASVSGAPHRNRGEFGDFRPGPLFGGEREIIRRETDIIEGNPRRGIIGALFGGEREIIRKETDIIDTGYGGREIIRKETDIIEEGGLFNRPREIVRKEVDVIEEY